MDEQIWMQEAYGMLDIPGYESKAAMLTSSATVFKEQTDTPPLIISEDLRIIPWGHDNEMPFSIIEYIDRDETLATCQAVNAETCYAAGLRYERPDSGDGRKAEKSGPSGLSQGEIRMTPQYVKDHQDKIADEIDDFFIANDIPSYWLGVCTDLRYFGMAITVIILNEDASRIVAIRRKEACYCRFAPAPDGGGPIPEVIYANWRIPGLRHENIERIPLLDPAAPWPDLQRRIELGTADRKFAIATRIPTVDSTYYPIPWYGALFRGKWYDIKQLIALAKEAKLKNSAPIKYHIELNKGYWDRIFQREGITDPVKKKSRVIEEKQNIVRFLTGAENSGKTWFSTYYVTPDGHIQHDVVINRIEASKEGGDWETDIQEAINMVCFTMRVHSNLVGSVPGKSQSNNSGSDKRELYTIAQATQKAYRDLLFMPHRIICRFNKWTGYAPVCPLIQLTTLDAHTDARTADIP